jgi:CubicO group peptidase (beta-lactamase class C family)
MKSKKFIKRILLLLFLLVLGYGIHYAWFSFPIISGYSAKNACSCAFIQGRSKESITAEELDAMPLSLGSIMIDYKDSSVTGTVFGLAKRKAIYRNGLGCTLVNDYSEETIRSQKFAVPTVNRMQDSINWPEGDHAIDSIKALVNVPKLNKALSFLFDHSFNGKAALTRAALIVYKGKIVAERYAPGYNKDSKFLGWSMAKSVTSALVGILVKEGKLNVKAAAPVAEWSTSSDKRHGITLEHLLQQRSGLNFLENYSKHSDATHMLFDVGNMAAYVANLSSKETPGSRFYYSSGNSNIISRIIRTTVGEQAYQSFPYNALFYKIGMFHTLFEPDASGTFVGSSYIYATARDYARFGLLYLNDGVWNGERILPEGWVKQTTTAPSTDPLKHYGYQFWLNGKDDEDSTRQAYPEMPGDLFLADGYGGQRIYIVPSKQLVIVRTGLNKFDEHHFLKEVMASLK